MISSFTWSGSPPAVMRVERTQKTWVWSLKKSKHGSEMFVFLGWSFYGLKDPEVFNWRRYTIHLGSYRVHIYIHCISCHACVKELADIWSQKTTLERLDLVEHAAHLVIAAGPRRALTNTWGEFTSSANQCGSLQVNGCSCPNYCPWDGGFDTLDEGNPPMIFFKCQDDTVEFLFQRTPWLILFWRTWILLNLESLKVRSLKDVYQAEMQVKKAQKHPKTNLFTTHNSQTAMAPPSPRFVDGLRHFAVEDEAGYVEHFRPEAKALKWLKFSGNGPKLPTGKVI